MENQSNSSNAREQERLNSLRIYTDKKAGQWLSGFSFFEDLQSTFTSKKTLADYSITAQKSEIHFLSNKTNFSISTIADDLGAKLIYSLITKPADVHYENLTDQYTNESKKFYKKCKKLQDFLALFRTIGPFKSYQSSQVLIHEKGKSSAISLAKHRDTEIEKSNVSVSSFNNIFSKIKKSKNKQFDQTDILSDDIQVVGSFLAKEFNFHNHSLIFILSREDFFSPSDIEREYFDQFLTISIKEVEILVNSFMKEDRIEYFISLIQAFPFYINVSSAQGSISSNHAKPSNLISKDIDGIQIEYDALTQLQSDPDYYHHERLVLMGELLNTLRHELSNPLFGINISTNLLLSDTYEKDNEVIETIEEVGKSSERCQSIIENFSGLYGDRNIQQEIKLKDLINETLTLTKSESKQFGRSIEFIDIEDTIQVFTNPTYLSQIIFNLIINSSQALKSCEQESKAIFITVSKDSEFVRLNISDNGPGIPDKLRAKIFDPFYTTKESGTGLGLSICKNLAKKIGAKLVLNESNTGASFSLLIPMEQ